MKSKLVFGSDPEFFAGYTKDNILYCLPPVFFRKNLGVPFIKNGRHPIFIETDNGTKIHEDGAAFELALTPSTNWEDVFDRIEEGRKTLENSILRHFIPFCDGKLYVTPTIGYDVERWMKEADDDFINCTLFGCDPDEDAFHTEKKCKIIDASIHPFRYGGGHIHISGSRKIKEEPLDAIYSLALTVGLAAVAYSDTPELDRERTYLYGMPGKFRRQKYPTRFGKYPFTNTGIEYRTPSNRWTSSKEIASQVFKWADVGIHYLLEQNALAKFIGELRQPCIDAILGCQQNEAKNILNTIEAGL